MKYQVLPDIISSVRTMSLLCALLVPTFSFKYKFSHFTLYLRLGYELTFFPAKHSRNTVYEIKTNSGACLLNADIL